jgi:hypothetical protein
MERLEYRYITNHLKLILRIHLMRIGLYQSKKYKMDK